MSNEITAYFKGRTGVAESVYQYDYGMVLVLDGIELPENFDCYFSNEGDEEATPAIGAEYRVAIPNKCLAVPGILTVHIPVSEGSNDSEVEYIVSVKVINRAKPVDDGTEADRTAISKAISALNHNNLPGLIPDAVNDWLDDHPEATTTVQDGAVTVNKLADEKLKLYSLHLSNSAELGDVTILAFPNGEIICCDTGYIGQEDAIDAFMSSHDITHIDILITTHFHSDHVGCFQHVAETYCNEDTVFYRCMDWDVTKFAAPTITIEEYESIVSGLNATSLIPEQNEIVEPWDHCALRFLNTDSSFLADYYTSQSDTSVTGYVDPSLNNLSLITEVTWMNKKILLTGDAEKAAQQKNAAYIGSVDILKVPHHNWNMNGYYGFFLNASPKIAFFNRNTPMDFPNQAPHYWDRMQMQMMGERPTYQTLTENVEIEIDNYSIEVVSGDSYAYTALCNQNDQRLLRFIPSVKSSYHFWAHNTWSIDDVLEMITESPYLEEAMIDLRSTTVMTNFIAQLKAVIGTSYNVYSVHPFKNGFELTATSALNNNHKFHRGFHYADASTYSMYYRKNAYNDPWLTRTSVASNTNMKDYAVTLPNGVHFRTMNNFSGSDFPAGGNYWVTFYVTNTNYITIEAVAATDATKKYLIQRQNGTWTEWKSITYA